MSDHYLPLFNVWPATDARGEDYPVLHLVSTGATYMGRDVMAFSVAPVQGSYTNVVGNTTVTIKQGEGELHRITLNQIPANSAITLYDNIAASGDKIGTITTPGLISAPTVPALGEMVYNCLFSNGLTVVCPPGCDLTVVWR